MVSKSKFQFLVKIKPNKNHKLQNSNKFLKTLEEEYEIPSYIVMLLNVTKYNNEESLKQAFRRDPSGLRATIQEEGVEILTSDYYTQEMADSFKAACVKSFINPTKGFRLKPGDWDLLVHILEKLCSGKQWKKSRAKRRKLDAEHETSTFISEENINRLNNLLKKDYPKNLHVPDRFLIREISLLSWEVKCPVCGNFYKIQLQHEKSVNFNRGNFSKHLEIHEKHKNTQTVHDNTSNFGNFPQEDSLNNYFDSSSTMNPSHFTPTDSYCSTTAQEDPQNQQEAKLTTNFDSTIQQKSSPKPNPVILFTNGQLSRKVLITRNHNVTLSQANNFKQIPVQSQSNLTRAVNVEVKNKINL